MIGNNLVQLTGTKRSLLALLASSALFTAGCSNMLTTAPGSASLSAAQSAIGGKVHGGSQPVSGATVTLYYAGQDSNPIAAAVAQTDSTGSFSFTKGAPDLPPAGTSTYSCPTSTTDPLVYVIARGGNTVGDGITADVNSAAAFIGIYGTCNEISSASTLTLNELTTVATMLAVHQYFDPRAATYGLTSDGSGSSKIAIYNTIATIANMVNTATGTIVTSRNVAGVNGLSAVSVTATAESTKVNLLANIITSCINNTSASATNCQTLFSSAVAPDSLTTNLPGVTFPAPTDVLQALYYMLTNPTSGGTTNMQALFNLASGAAAAYQPALATQPLDWTVAINFTSTSTCGGGGAVISSPNALAVDLYGGIWVANGQASTGNLIQLGNNGSVATCISFAPGIDTTKGAVFIDSTGKIWSALNGSTTLTRYNTIDASNLQFTSAAPVLAIAGDGNGNVYFSTAAGLYEVVGGATAVAVTTPTLVSSTVTNATSLMPDLNGSIWATSGTGSLWQVNGSTVTPFTTTANTRSLAVTTAGNVFVSSVGPSNGISYFTNAGSGYTIQNGWPTSAGGVNQAASIAIDGASNVWSANLSPSITTLFGVSEISAAANPLSPDGAPGGFQKAATYLNGSNSIIVDQSGNVWIAGAGNSNNFVTELVGAGVPIYQPYAQGIVNGRFQGAP
jgi:hypothetical protein